MSGNGDGFQKLPYQSTIDFAVVGQIRRQFTAHTVRCLRLGSIFTFLFSNITSITKEAFPILNESNNRSPLVPRCLPLFCVMMGNLSNQQCLNRCSSRPASASLILARNNKNPPIGSGAHGTVSLEVGAREAGKEGWSGGGVRHDAFQNLQRMRTWWLWSASGWAEPNAYHPSYFFHR